MGLTFMPSLRFCPRLGRVSNRTVENEITREEKDLYLEALRALSERKVDYMLGGAVAVHYYTGWWRATHDLDV